MTKLLALSALLFLFWGWLSQPGCNRKAEGRIIEEESGINFKCESKVGSHLPSSKK